MINKLATIFFLAFFGQFTVVYTNEVGSKSKNELAVPIINKLESGWESKIDYENETLQRLFWMAASGEPKWADIRKKADSTLVARKELAIPFLISKLSVDDARQRQAVNNLLKKIGTITIPYLSHAIDTTKSNDVLSLAIKTIGDIGDSSTVSMLIQFTYDTNRVKKVSAVAALASYNKNQNEFVPRFRELIHDTIPSVRRYAYRGLIKAQDNESIKDIICGIHDTIYSVRETIFFALTAIVSPADTSKSSLRKKELKFLENVKNELEKILQREWGYDSIPYFSSDFIVQHRRFQRFSNFSSFTLQELYNYLNLYRLINGNNKKIWNRASEYPSEVIRLLALQYFLHFSKKSKKDLLKIKGDSHLLKGQELTKQFRLPIQ
ncbi:MAG: HEAT repeat domain-containing protein [bacterium]|nr:HEAT repeat domain-containing protein [bacterium]